MKDQSNLPAAISETGAIAALAEKAVGTEVNAVKRLRDGDVPFVVIDNGRQLKSAADIVKAFEATQPAPYRRRGTYSAASVQGLLDWMRAHAPESAPVFGEGAERLAKDWAQPSLALVGIANYSAAEKAEWHDLTARYEFPVTLAWQKWVAKSGTFMSQGDFAEFIEEHLYEIDQPKRGETLSEPVTRMIEALGGAKFVADPSKVYALAHGVKINVSEKVEVKLDRSTGEATMHFTEEHTGVGGRPVAIPKFFYARVPVFFGEDPSLIGVMLRYRNAGSGQVVWCYEIFAPDLVVKEAFEKACDVVKKARGTLYLGSPDRPV